MLSINRKNYNITQKISIKLKKYKNTQLIKLDRLRRVEYSQV